LKTRINEHGQDINKKSGNFSVVTEHKLEYGHDFDWNGVEILDTEKFYNKRLISENLHIKRQVNSINKQIDTELFPDIYLPILHKLPTWIFHSPSLLLLLPFPSPSFPSSHTCFIYNLLHGA